MQEISTPASADSTLTSDSHETSLPVLGMADSATTDEPATSTHGKDDSSNDDFTLTAASSELPPSAEEELADDDELVFHAPSTVPSAPISSSVPSLRSRSRQQVLSRGRDPVAPEQPRRNAPRKLDGFSSANSNSNNIHSVEGESNEGNAVPSLEAGTRPPGISLEQNLFQEVQQSIAAAEPVRTFVGRPLRPVVAPLSPAGVESSAVHQSSRSRSRASTPAPTPVELPPSPPPRRPAPSRPAQDEEGAAVAAPGGGEYEYEYYYDYLDDSPHSTDYDLVPLSAKVTTSNQPYIFIFYFYMLGIEMLDDLFVGILNELK